LGLVKIDSVPPGRVEIVESVVAPELLLVDPVTALDLPVLLRTPCGRRRIAFLQRELERTRAKMPWRNATS
jgi:hypothetical protein